MSCNNPLFRLPTISEAVPAQFQHRVKHGAIIMNRKDKDYLVNVCKKSPDLFQQIPCGQCSACRLEYSRQWAIRCSLESMYYANCWFVTITYDDAHLPRGLKLDNETGEIMSNSRGELLHVLDDSDATKFLKRLRITAERNGWRNGKDVRYFYCGEYGEQYKRPHFHFLFFGLDLPDVEPLYVKRKHRFFYSKTLEEIWGKGNVIIGELCFDSCAYVARYVMKKQKGKSAEEMRDKIKTVIFNGDKMTISDFRDEFCRMSRRPGIGKKYFDEHKDNMYLSDSLYVQCSKGLQKVKPCRYYDNLYDVQHSEELERIKAHRRAVGKASSLSRSKRTSLTEEQYLQQKELTKIEQVKRLKRDVE